MASGIDKNNKQMMIEYQIPIHFIIGVYRLW